MLVRTLLRTPVMATTSARSIMPVVAVVARAVPSCIVRGLAVSSSPPPAGNTPATTTPAGTPATPTDNESATFATVTSKNKAKSRHILKAELEGALKPKSEMDERAISRDGVEKLPLSVNFLEDVIRESDLSEAERNQIRQMAHLSNASGPEIKRWRLNNIVAKYQLHQHDRGSVEVQVAMLCERIRSMREHLAKNHKDVHNRRNISVLIQRRRKYLMYLRRHNFAAYQRIMLDFRLNERELDTFGDIGRAKMAKPTIRW